METIRDFKNSLLKRREIEVSIDSVENPGFENSKKMVAEKFKAQDDSIVVRSVKGKFGRHNYHLDVFIYDSAKDRERFERKPKVKKEAKK